MSMFGGAQGQQTRQINPRTIMQSSAGATIPILYGTDRVTPVFIGIGNFETIPPSGGKKFSPGGKAAPAFTTYRFSAAMGLVQGPGPVGLRRVWQSGGAGMNNQEMDPQTAGALWTFFNGAQGQAPWTELGLNLGFTALAYTAQSEWNIGGSAQPPQVTFEVMGILAGQTLNLKNQGIGLLDCVPSDMLVDLFTNPLYGCGIPSTMIGQETPGGGGSYGFFYQTFQEGWAYCQAAQIYLSVLMDTQRNASEWVSEILEIINADLIFTSEAFYLKPYADKVISAPSADDFFPTITYTPIITPIRNFTDNDYVVKKGDVPVTVDRPLSVDRYNEIIVEYLDRTKRYDTCTTSAKLQTSIDLFQVRPSDTLSYHEIKRADVARAVAQLRLQRINFSFNTYTFTVAPIHIDLDPMDIVSITDPNSELSLYPVRIIKIEEDKDLNLTLTCQDIFPGTTKLYPTQPAIGSGIGDSGTDPGDVNTPIIFEPTSVVTGGVQQIWFAASGAPGQFGGCSVWLSTDGGVSYYKIGTVVGSNAQGLLLATLATHADPDTVDTLEVDESLSGGNLTAISDAQADLYNNLAYVDGEWISFAAVSALPNNQFNLSYLRRGAYGTTIGAHATGAAFAFLGSVSALAPGIFTYTVPPTPDIIGSTLSFKFTAFNLFGMNEQALSSVPAYSYTYQGLGLSPGTKQIGISYEPVPSTNQIIFQQTMGTTARFPTNLAGSFATLATAATAITVYALKKNGTGFGTITFAASGTVGAFSATATSFASGDILTLVAPASPDATAAGLNVTLVYS